METKINVFDHSRFTTLELALENYPLMVGALAKKLATPTEDLVHMAMGLSGEMAELLASNDRTNTIEELGDGLFYFCGFCLLIDRPEDFEVQLSNTIDLDTIDLDTMAVFKNLVITAGEVLDQVKKTWVYNKPLDLPTVILQLNLWYGYWQLAVNQTGATVLDVIQANVAKLNKRYPDGLYTDAHAQARLDKLEPIVGQHADVPEPNQIVYLIGDDDHAVVITN